VSKKGPVRRPQESLFLIRKLPSYESRMTSKLLIAALQLRSLRSRSVLRIGQLEVWRLHVFTGYINRFMARCLVSFAYGLSMPPRRPLSHGDSALLQRVRGIGRSGGDSRGGLGGCAGRGSRRTNGRLYWLSSPCSPQPLLSQMVKQAVHVKCLLHSFCPKNMLSLTTLRDLTTEC